MWYIFNRNGECVSECDFEPNHADLATRGEIALESEQPYELSNIYCVDAKIHVRSEQPTPFHVWQPEKRKWFLSKYDEKQALQAAKAAKIAELNKLAQEVVNKLAGMDKLPEFEIQSWSSQAAEAKAWLDDKTTPTPLLDKIAEARGVEADLFRHKVWRKVIQYENLIAQIAGLRQALQAQIESASTLAELNAIEITFRQIE